MDYRIGQVVKFSDGNGGVQTGKVVNSRLTHFTGPIGAQTRYSIRVERGTESQNVAIDEKELDLFNR